MEKPLHNLISEQQPVEASEQRLRALVNATSDMIYRMSADWLVLQELDGRGFLPNTNEPNPNWIKKYIHPSDREKLKLAINEALETKKIFQLEHRVLQADGTTGWTSSRAVPIVNELGEIIEWFGTASDITDRKQAEEGLRTAKEQSEQQKRLYETITSNTPDLMYVFDLNYNFIYANDALLSMWGKSSEDAIGKGLLENGYEPWHAEMHEREIDHIIATKESVRGEVSFPHAVLGRRVYDYILIPVVNEAGKVEAVAGTTRDISDIKEHEQRKNDFISMVSHELKTPLTSLIAYLQLLDKIKVADNEIGERAIFQSLKQTRRMTNMINGFLNLARLESGKLFIEKINFDISKLVKDIEEEVLILYPNHTFIFEPVESVIVNADKAKINQVFINLINNAVKYSELGSTVQISCVKIDDAVFVQVKDEGVGILQEEVPKLFERFYRVQHNNLIAGFGIGLFLCKEIIAGHGGEIGVKSVLAKGSTFHFTLPLKSE
ncbi:PAS domain S-box protein [Pedobacter aquatilis]|uniref:PAS domain-containing sensor histidine kinase n=1 Tax=Pedobacter aquatilis TaxID=351343 RepID=UPI00292CF16F|nr:PAS domain S-box protein [Pedobacter aquatilis]